ncbi:MAG: lysophospholipid acyltransferase family protein [Phycisphaeraceae bacterium]|nr:lysophospholipid acyltransferase family protein [Phycisphaeraceae bacterium]
MSTKPFKISFRRSRPIRDTMLWASRPIVERALRFPAMNAIYEEIQSWATDDRHFSDKALSALGVEVDTLQEQVDRIPNEGPVVVVANHPFGGIEGLILCSMLRKVRPDAKLLANNLLSMIPDLRDSFFFVNAFEGKDAIGRNIGPTRAAMRWVKDGHLLGAFPAGEVAHLKLRKRAVVDPQWNPTTAKIIQRTGAAVVPIFFDGYNSRLFQVAGLIHPRLRTVMLPTEMLRKRNAPVTVRVGSPISPDRLARFDDPNNLNDYLRVRAYLLKPQKESDEMSADAEANADVIDAVPKQALVDEIADLPDGQQLLSQGEFDVFYMRSPQCPSLMRELGRLRELTFREVGEGTGLPLDIDRFDDYYLQLVVWNSEKHEVVGGYRLGPTDEILPEYGKDGLYTNTLFKFRKNLLRQVDPALELGRSWVALDYQRSYAPLMLLWKGIGAYLVQNPRYRRLFGPVSISAEYSSMSKHLLTAFLTLHKFLPDLARLVSPRNPMKRKEVREFDRRAFSTVAGSLEEANELIKELEADGKPIPILLKQYLKLNGQLMGFNVDPDFGNVLDGLILIDVPSIDERVMKKYLGAETGEAYLRYHEAASAAR